MKKTVFFARTGRLAVLLTLAVCLLCINCGLKGNPIPDHSREAFAFGELVAEMSAGSVLTIHGQLTGASQNLDYFVLEIQPVEDELCLGCPFLAQEQQRFDSREILSNDSEKAFNFVYTPLSPAVAYRWRLLARNVYAGVPDILSEIQVVNRDNLSVGGVRP